MYMNYIDQLNQDADDISTPTSISDTDRPYSQQSSIAEEDRGDEDSEASNASAPSKLSGAQ
jgi:hypothetical protein